MGARPTSRLSRWLRQASPLASRARGRDGAPRSAAAGGVPRMQRLVAEPWYVDSVAFDGARLDVAGWSMPVAGAKEPAEGWFTVNGRRFDSLRYPLPRPDVGDLFWMREASSASGFEASIGGLDTPYPDGVLEIRRVGVGTRDVERGRDSWFRPDPALHRGIPDEDRRFRVIGNRDPDGFLVSGATDYHRIDRALRAMSGRHLHEFDRVLDWGVGCGRLARHFPARRAGALTGCDIDRDNVDWCAAHLPGRYVECAMAPPLPFPDASFDVVYGVSVFTHLREPMQLRWLAELARVTSPGAWILVTVHGRTAIDFSRLPPEEYVRLVEEVDAKGILETGTNAQLDGHADHGGEYVNVFHGFDYIRRVWGRSFAVADILPGYILHHDLVVLRTR